MTTIPEAPEVDWDAKLRAWYTAKLELANARKKEYAMRAEIIEHFFPEPAEGTNLHPIGDGYDLILSQPYERKVDEAEVAAHAEIFEKLGVSTDDVFRKKLELAKRVYNGYSEEQQRAVDECLIVKPSSPSLNIDLSKQAKKAKAEAAVKAEAEAVKASAASEDMIDDDDIPF